MLENSVELPENPVELPENPVELTKNPSSKSCRIAWKSCRMTKLIFRPKNYQKFIKVLEKIWSIYGKIAIVMPFFRWWSKLLNHHLQQHLMKLGSGLLLLLISRLIASIHNASCTAALEKFPELFNRGNY